MVKYLLFFSYEKLSPLDISYNTTNKCSNVKIKALHTIFHKSDTFRQPTWWHRVGYHNINLISPLMRTVVRIYKTSSSASYGPVLHCYQRIFYMQTFNTQI